ncbi:retrovirus-related pol polyprotein from transposon TNT 1-94 [Tanacetum coccineum]
MNVYPELNNESYVIYDRVMNPLTTQLERKPRRDRGMRKGRHSTSSLSAFDQPSSSHLNDDDDDETSRASTPSPIQHLGCPPRPLNPQPLQSHPSLDIALSLSPITPLDHIHDTLSPPSPPPPQPPIMGHPLFYNYHGSIKTPYEILRGRKPTLDYFRVFGSKCFILNTKDYLTKFDPKSYEGVFLSYSQNSKAYIILNKHTRKIEELLNVTFDETPPPSKTSPLVDDELDEEEAIKVTERKNLENDIEDETLEIDEIVNIKESRNHPLENIIGNLNQRTLRSQAQNQSNSFCFISTIKPKNANEALTDKSRIIAMQDELNQFIANNVWKLVPQPRNMTIIGTKWVFRNKLVENGSVS